MFKPGDKVIFIGDNNNISGEIKKIEHRLVYGNVYEIYEKCSKCSLVTELLTPYYTNDSFVTLKYFRLLKLKKLKK